MQINQKRFGVALTYVSEAVKILSSLIYTPLMLRLLGQSEFGLYQLVSSVVAYLGLLSFGFGSAYIRYYSRYQVKGNQDGIARLNGMFALVFCSISAVCILCGCVMAANAQLVFGDKLTAGELGKAKILLLILVVNMALTFPNSLFNCYITAHERFFFQRLLTVLQNIFNPFLTLPLLLMGYDSVAVVAVTTVLGIAVFAVNGAYCFRKLRMRFCFRGLKFALLGEMWVFTFFIFLNNIIDQVNWNVGKLLLGRYTGTVAVAVYGVGTQINTLYMQLSTAISSVFVPEVNRIVAESDDNGALTRLMAKVGRIQFLLLALVLSGFAFFGKPFIRLWAGPEYGEAYLVALLLIAPFTVPLVQNLGLEIQRAKNMHRARSLVCLALAVGNVLVSINLVRRWGCTGAAFGTSVSLILGNILFMNWYYQRKIGLDMVAFWKQIGGFVPALLLACPVGWGISCLLPITGWVSLGFGILVYSVVYASAMWLLGLNHYEKNLIRGIVEKLVRKQK